ncbi:MAG: proline iminopeptidase-family hydrolase [Candidatus Cloacimonetes bacterium]|nr:proline iminopeptidase-family hydrolase [Candidatus Cloacimonadota bacterium]MCF7869398.1 proline iminopeptidase-family hydrolase [Candidatus Cloacimonadota bacterium]
MEEGFISVTGGKVWYKIVGKNKSEIPLLILHGGPGASHTYLEPLEKLADKRPVVFYDQLGCGNSERPADTSLWTIDRFVEELQQVRNSLGLDQVHLLGQSWGSSLAAEYILTKKPEGVKSVILSGALLSTSSWIADQQIYIEQLPEKTRNAILQCEKTGEYNSPEYQNAMMEFYQLHVYRLESWPECLNRAFSELNFAQYEYMWGPSEFTVTGSLKNYERVDQLYKIDLPVLFTCGEFDEATPATTRYYQENLPGSRLHIFEDASHEHHLEKTKK